MYKEFILTIIATNGLVGLIRLSINRARWNRIYAMLNKMCQKVDNLA